MKTIERENGKKLLVVATGVGKRLVFGEMNRVEYKEDDVMTTFVREEGTAIIARHFLILHGSPEWTDTSKRGIHDFQDVHQ